MTITLPIKNKLVSIAKEHALLNAGLLLIFLRISLYCTGMLSSCFLAEKFFCDTYTANLCFFFLFSVLIELIWNLPKTGIKSCRTIVYIFCVIGIILAGSTLIHQGKCCQACASYKIHP